MHYYEKCLNRRLNLIEMIKYDFSLQSLNRRLNLIGLIQSAVQPFFTGSDIRIINMIKLVE